MTTAKLKPLIFSVLGFAFSNLANISIFMILDDFCMLPASRLAFIDLLILFVSRGHGSSWSCEIYRLLTLFRFGSVFV
jgi:hypothetical protein